MMGSAELEGDRGGPGGRRRTPSPRRNGVADDKGEPADPVPGKLPLALDSFVGRDRDRAELARLLGSARLVTLTGPSGVGKTRLALRLATDVSARFPGGAWLVDLAPLSGPALVAQAVADVLSVRQQPGRPLADTLVANLRHRRLLLILDNCEHVVGGAAALAEALLRACPDVVVLATSQEPLAVAGERVWQVPPLSVPDAQEREAQTVAGYEAVRLFCERARQVEPAFALTPDLAPAVAAICRSLDGLPFAIELAAARIGVLGPAEIAARLVDRFRLLTGGSRTVRARHQSLESALQWSHDLLDPPERALLRRLGVFAGGCTLEAAEDVCAGDEVEGPAVFDLLSALAAKSLVVTDTSGPEARYRLLETVRAFALERLVESGDHATRRARHARWFLGLAERAEPHLTGADQQRWLERLEAEHDNLRGALEWALADGHGDVALRLAGALVLFWRVRGHFSEGRQWLQSAIAAGQGADGHLVAKALWGTGFLALMLEDFAAAVPLLEQSLALYGEMGDDHGISRSLLLLGNCRLFEDPPNALSLLEQARAVARRAGDHWCLAHALALSGLARIQQNDVAGARLLLEECLAVARTSRDNQGRRIGLTLLGCLDLRQGNYASAEALLRQALAVVAELGETFGGSVVLSALGELSMGRGEYDQARQLLQEALAAARRTGNPSTIAESLCLLGRVAEAEGDIGAARPLFEASLSVAQKGGGTCGPALQGLARVSQAEGDLDRGRCLFEEALRLARSSGDDQQTAGGLHGLGELARTEGRHDRATSLHTEALQLRGRLGHGPGIAESLDALAGVAVELGRFEHATRLLGAARSLRNEHGYARAPVQRAGYDRDLARARAGLDVDEFEVNLAQGEKLSWKEAVSYASRGRGARGGGVKASKGWESLTPAERDVVALVVEGMTSAEIAQTLFVSPRTVSTHLTHVFAKLGLTSRRELARLAKGADGAGPAQGGASGATSDEG